VLREGLTVVLAGAPNVGKSSILNRLAGEEVAIVTPIPGTTRDYVRATIALQGVPVHLIDTAGLRETDDPVEKIGVERAWRAIESAGAALVIESAVDEETHGELGLERIPPGLPRARVVNKIDLLDRRPPARNGGSEEAQLHVSARTGEGIEALRAWLLETAGWKPHGEGLFLARERHVQALEETRAHLAEAAIVVQAFDLMAEELRLAQLSLSRITGAVIADDVLGAIFSRFCVGK
jgi:tRNA modification GTPase